jgi:hypothetical protein
VPFSLSVLTAAAGVYLLILVDEGSVLHCFVGCYFLCYRIYFFTNTFWIQGLFKFETLEMRFYTRECFHSNVFSSECPITIPNH